MTRRPAPQADPTASQVHRFEVKGSLGSLLSSISTWACELLCHVAVPYSLRDMGRAASPIQAPWAQLPVRDPLDNKLMALEPVRAARARMGFACTVPS